MRMIYREDIRLKWLAAMNKYFTVIQLIEEMEAELSDTQGKKKHNIKLYVSKSAAKKEAQFWDEILYIIDKEKEHAETINNLTKLIPAAETAGTQV